MSYIEAIQELKKIDLSTYPADRVRKLIDKLGRFGIISIDLHPGKTIIRARPNNPVEIFKNRSELSYVPQSKNHKYQRASTPNQTMFYGGTIPENIREGELNNARVI